MGIHPDRVRIPLRNSGILSAHGYENVREKSELSRHRALLKVVRAGEPPLALFRRLNVLMILFKNKDLEFLRRIETG